MRALRVGLTGGIGAGKSLALREFGRLGAKTISSDDVARDVVLPGTPAYRGVLKAFGAGVLGAQGRLDRKKLADLVFSSAQRRRRLERVIYPEILREISRRLKRLGPKEVAVVDMPLLFEHGHQSRFDAVVFISAPAALRARRARRRDGLSLREIGRRMEAQWPEARKAALADVVISNAGGRGRFLRSIREYQKAFALMSASSEMKAG